jgi:hypothetical protein
MSAEPNQPPESNTNNAAPKIFWLLLALSPTVIMLAMVGNMNGAPLNKTLMLIVVFGINPILSIFGCYRLFWKPDGERILNIVLAIFLGGAIAFLNVLIALFAACAMHPFNLNG